ncbi:hypothetical protein [Halorussus salinisoli]|uniref:hypothetical protein n=1 Tax=Halorussus salinisoli TaxID=2558242 RepID=UPI0010C212DB|nr:hypothetical protein [Halorussus salinisoli]
MADESDSPRRRDVLRAGAAAGVLGLAGFTVGGASAQQVQNAFSLSLQEGDQFRVRFRPRDPQGNPATQTIPGECFEDGEQREVQILIVRALRDEIDLGYRGLFVPQRVLETRTPETTTPAEETPTLGDETTPGNETTPADDTTTEAALQEETTPGNETTTPADETTPAETTPGARPELPEILVGEWYSVVSSSRCNDFSRLTLERTEPPETTPVGGSETTTG